MAQRSLIGVSPDQVSTNGMLGDLAFQDSDSAYIETIRGKVSLDKLDKEITDTATDIFVYDTSKDSDGGAWRKRTTHTTWYNETLNTSVRGIRREFPAVAVIVAEAAQVTIYDGDDPDLPMWMVFTTTWTQAWRAPTLLSSSSSTVTSLSAMNGNICCGSSPFGLKILNFISEKSEFREQGYYRKYDHPFILRASTSTSAGTDLGSDGWLVNDTVNDIAMTVLPNALIDSATELPVPTIAVGTNGGVSIIKDDGNVVDITGTSQGSDMPVDMISFVGNGKIMYSHRYASEVNTISSSDVTAAYYNQTSTWLGRISNSISHDSDTDVSALSSDDNIESIAITETFAASKSISGLSLANNYAIQNDPDRASCFITTKYNTGWMHGDIKGAFLSDTDTTTLYGTNLNLITNGDFSNGTTGWSSDQILTESGGVASVQRNAGPTGQCYQTITTEAGRTYTVSVNVTALSNGFQVYAGGAPTAASIQMSQGAVNATGTHYWIFTAISTSTRLDFSAVQSGTATASFDDITIFNGVADRSVNHKGLQVFGTITKSAVATGAELVGYSGFPGNGATKTNYLEQPYNADLDFSTTFCFMGWIKVNASTGVDQHFFDLTNSAGANRLNIYYNDGGESFYFNTGGTSASVSFGQWYHLVVTGDSSGTKMYLNGVLKSSTSGAYSKTMNSDNFLTLGTRYSQYLGTSYGLDGSMALIRLSKSIPSAEQVKKMYEDERFLFQENAACTLYGSSDAVTALAYDEVTEQLHVGTSSGRSDFQGLRRINNTTKAVSTAISAHDGLIAQQ